MPVLTAIPLRFATAALVRRRLLKQWGCISAKQFRRSRRTTVGWAFGAPIWARADGHLGVKQSRWSGTSPSATPSLAQVGIGKALAWTPARFLETSDKPREA